MKQGKGVAIIVVILACLLGLGYYSYTIVSATSVSQSETDNSVASKGIKLGLDLSGGVSITYQIVDENPSASDIKDTIAIISNLRCISIIFLHLIKIIIQNSSQ